MNYQEYAANIDCALQFAGSGPGWNARFVYCLDTLGLCLRPERDQDITGNGLDMLAPMPDPNDQVTWPTSRIRLKK